VDFLGAPIRIGIVADRREAFENWELMVFDRIMSDPRFLLVTILVQPDACVAKRSSFLFGLESRIERWALARQDPYEPSRFDPSLQRFDVLADATGDGIDAAALTKLVGRLKLGLVLRLTTKGLPDAAVARLAYGEWAFTFSDQRAGDADWFGYQDVIEKRPSTQLTLYARRGSDAARGQIASASFNLKISAARNAAFIRERAVTFLMRELGRLADTRKLITDPLPAETSGPPTVYDLSRYIGGLAKHLASRLLKASRGDVPDTWTLYTGQGCIQKFEPAESVEIPPVAGDIKADPFLFQHEGECYLFYEACSRSDPKAHIAVGRFDGDHLEQLGPVLVGEDDLSYPFVFRVGEDIFMMPETHRSRRIEIWRCIDFPMKWELYSTALEGFSAADSVLTEHAGKWWLFTSISDFHAYEDHCSELYVFEVDGPGLNRVTPHKRNPVVMGSAVARNGGRIFERDGKLYRPSQRSAHGIFGYGLNIMEIEQLDLENYSERCVRTIEPGFKAGVHGCHHFDAAGGRYVVDARLTV
jgi:hypothetical protein